ncbi:hypothetical protein, partial [Nonomuraea rubra]|uniref:hypothetical protein n=1 Tax=Nonomuraea rubra TaxID=46180 RepID=UPI0031E83AE1
MERRCTGSVRLLRTAQELSDELHVESLQLAPGQVRSLGDEAAEVPVLAQARRAGRTGRSTACCGWP